MSRHAELPGDGERAASRGWIDITRPLGPGVPVWPGDAPFRIDADRSGQVTVSQMQLSCHVGTHVDAPRHLDPTARGVASIPLDRLIGRVDVVHRPLEGGRVGLEVLECWSPSCERVLIRTDCLPLGQAIGHRIAGIETELVHALAERGVILLGIDSPSVDLYDDEQLRAHYALLEHDMTWIEGLWLGPVGPGAYEMAALPLALGDVDAAPVRAVLRPVTVSS